MPKGATAKADSPIKEVFETSTGKTVYTHDGKQGSFTIQADQHMSKKHRSFLNVASKVACESDVLDHQHGAVVVSGGSVLAIASNKWRNRAMVYTCPSDTYNQTLTVHAEIAALSRLTPEQAKGATIYIARLARDGEGTKFSRPCERCMAEIVRMGIKTIVYTCE